MLLNENEKEQHKQGLAQMQLELKKYLLNE